jgi:hypothetical protein
MGLNILIYDAAQQCIVDVPGFDTGKYAGDDDFIGATTWKYTAIPDDVSVMRPRDSEALRAWVRATIYPGNQDRLLWLIDHLNATPSHWLYPSW